MAEPWVILDAKAVMHHCYNMGKDPEGIIGKDGELHNSAEYAFRNFLNRYMDAVFKMVAPRRVLIANDGGIEYRRKLHPDYKLKRENKKKEIDPVRKEQSAKFFRAIQQFWAATGCTMATVKGVEADDLIAFFCERLPGRKLVYTTDGDLTALISPKYNTMITLSLNPVTGDNYKGVPIGSTNLITMNKSLLGDTSDQYGGIRGFGPAKWDHLVAEYGYDGIQELENCVKTKDYKALEEAIEACPDDKVLGIMLDDSKNWEVQYELAKLQPKLCEGVNGKKIIEIEWFKRVPDISRLTKILKEMYCFDSHLEKYEDFCAQTWLLDSSNLEDSDIDEALQAFSESPSVSFDYETEDAHYRNFETVGKGKYVDLMTSKITGVSFCFGNNNQYCFYIPTNHKDSNNVSKDVIKTLLEEFPFEHTPLVAHNNAFEGCVSQLNLGVDITGTHDTAIMSSYVDENKPAGLKSLSKDLLNYTQTTYAEVVGDLPGMSHVTADAVVKYGCDDSIVTAHLFDFFQLRMMLEGSWDFYANNEPYVQGPLTEAFINGVELDWDRLDGIHKRDLKNIDEKMATLKGLLNRHCQKPNEAGTLSYIAAEGQNVAVMANAKAKAAFDKKFELLSELGSSQKEEWVKDKAIRIGEEAIKEGADLGYEELESLATGQFNKSFPDFDPNFEGQKIKDIEVAGKVAEASKKFREKVRLNSTYVPYEVTTVMPEFKPTVTTLNKVAEQLNFSEPLPSVAKSRISEWVANVTSYDFDDKAAEDTAELTSDQKSFIEALSEAAGQLKSREGKEYETLKSICEPYLGDGKTISTGTELNLGSPNQVQYLLYVMLGLPVRNRTMPQFGSTRNKLNLEGSPATNDLAVDTALAHDLSTDKEGWKWKVLNAVKSCKESITRCSLYHIPYPLWRHPDDGRMHPQIRNCGTVTRRPSGTSPNILQVSKRRINGDMRGIYLPHKEKFDPCTNIWIPYEEPRVIIAPDFSQQELRILASESGDEMMQSAYIGADRKDIHSLTASGIVGLPYDEYFSILKDKSHESHIEMKRARSDEGKATNFLIAYMGTSLTLSTRLIIPYDDADDMMERTFSLYPGIREWQDEMGIFSRKHGYTQTAYGNRRHLSNNIFSSDMQIRRRMDRQAANAVIQGTAADILKIVIANMHKTKLFKQTNSIMLAPVYDEIASTVPVSKAIEYVNRSVELMELTPPGHAVPMESDVAIGADWQALIEIGVRPSDDAIMEACEKSVKLQESKAA